VKELSNKLSGHTILKWSRVTAVVGAGFTLTGYVTSNNHFHFNTATVYAPLMQYDINRCAIGLALHLIDSVA
jgi:hypothetical protein